MPRNVVVIGGGISGLSVAYELRERASRFPAGLEVSCLEAEDRPGGNIRSERAEGHVAEWGPNGFLDNVPATLELARRLGLGERLLPADRAAEKRYIYRSGRLRKLPAGPFSFLASDVLSLRGRLRVLWEPFGPGPPAGEDESVFRFAARRIGEEAARILVSAMVTGIYAGDARRLSLRSTFPKMWQMEHDHGSLTRAMLRRRKERKADRVQGRKAGGPTGPGGHLTSFPLGLEEFIEALGRALGPALRVSTRVTSISRGEGGRYLLEVAGGGAIEADAVVAACPAWSASKIVASLDQGLAKALLEIPSRPLVVVHTGFDAREIGGGPDGFGFLVPRGEGLRILGTLWASSIFPLRAPRERVLLTTMLGGAHDPEAVHLDEADLLALVRRDLQRSMGLDAAPSFVRIYRHPRGIPQYTIGHSRRLEEIARRLGAIPGVFLSGNSYHGISVNLCVDEAPRVAERVLAHLAATPARPDRQGSA